MRASFCCTAALLLLAAGCRDTGMPAAAAADGAGTVALLPFDDAAVPGVPLGGDVVDGARWRDAMGEHLVLLVQTGAQPSTLDDCDDCRHAAVYAYHLVGEEGDWRQLWRVADEIRDCEFDLYAGFVEGSLVISDLDANDVPEVTFQYTLACRSDVSPAVRKLVMREGAAAYEIRGTTDLRRQLGAELGGGVMRVHPSFQQADAALRSFALREWHRLITKDDFEQF